MEINKNSNYDFKSRSNPSLGLNDSIFIADKYYYREASWLNNLLIRKETSDYVEVDGRLIQTIAIKMTDSRKQNQLK